MLYTSFAVTGLVITVIFGCLAFVMKKKGYVPGSLSLATGNFIEHYHLIFLLIVFAVFLFSRLLKLEAFPNGFHVDELSMAVDAKSILYHGTDRGGIRFPVYFRNYGGGQNALYIYIQALILKFLKPTIFAFRVQAVFWGAVCFFMMFGIAYELTGSRGWALSGPVLVTVLPVYVMSERWGLEAYLFLPFSSMVMFFAIRSVRSGKIRDFILTGVFMGLSLYTYAVSYIVWPVFLILSFLYLIYLKKIDLRKTLAFIVPLGILAFPLILFQLVNFKVIAPFSLGFTDFIPLPEKRGREVGLGNAREAVRFMGKLLLGGEKLTYNAVSEFGTIYLFLIPFVIIGLVICVVKTVSSLKTKTFDCHALILFFWAGSTMFMLVLKNPSVNRLNMIFMPFLLFIVTGVHTVLNGNTAAVVWMILWTGASFLFFMYFYFFIMNNIYGRHELFTDASFGRAIEWSEQYYMKDENTHIYVQYDNAAISRNQQTFYFGGGPGDVYSDDISTYGNVTAGLPEEIDTNENAVYIIGDEWGHITSWLISEGFSSDWHFHGCSILYRMD